MVYDAGSDRVVNTQQQVLPCNLTACDRKSRTAS